MLGKPISKVTKNKIIKMSQKGYLQKDIAEKCGISTGAVSSVVCKYRAAHQGTEGRLWVMTDSQKRRWDCLNKKYGRRK